MTIRIPYCGNKDSFKGYRQDSKEGSFQTAFRLGLKGKQKLHSKHTLMERGRIVHFFPCYSKTRSAAVDFEDDAHVYSHGPAPNPMQPQLPDALSSHSRSRLCEKPAPSCNKPVQDGEYKRQVVGPDSCSFFKAMCASTTWRPPAASWDGMCGWSLGLANSSFRAAGIE